MATPISRDIQNRETNARFWAATGYRPGHKLDPNNPTDKAMMPVWMEIFRKVKAEADADTLVLTYDKPEVAQPLADAELASTVAAVHVDAAAKTPDPTTVQQHADAAATALQVAAQKLREAAANQPTIVTSIIMEAAAREAAKTPPPPNAPAADQIAHAQTQNGQFLRPEDDPWYVPKSTSPRVRPAQPSRSPRERPSQAALVELTNELFWQRTNYKRGQKLDMSDSQDREMSKIWMEIFREVQREANEGRLPELLPAPNGVRPPSPRPTPRPTPSPRPTPPPQQTRPLPPPPQPPPPPPPAPQQPMPPPGMSMQPPGIPSWMTQPFFPPLPPPGMQPPLPQPGMQPGMQPVQQYQPFQQYQQYQAMQPVVQPGGPSIPTDTTSPPSPEELAAQATDEEAAATATSTQPTEEAAPSKPKEPTIKDAPVEEEGMSTTAKIGLGALGLIVFGGIVYAATRKPSRRSPRYRAAISSSPSLSAFPPSRGGRS